MSYNKERYHTLKQIAYYILFGVWYVASLLPMWFLHGVSSLMSMVLFYVIRYRREVVHENIKSSFHIRRFLFDFLTFDGVDLIASYNIYLTVHHDLLNLVI